MDSVLQESRIACFFQIGQAQAVGTRIKWQPQSLFSRIFLNLLMVEMLLTLNSRRCIALENNKQISWSLFILVHAGRIVLRRKFILYLGD